MKNLKSLIIFSLLFPNLSTALECDSNETLSCRYNGSTGLEFFGDIGIHNIQRQLVLFGDLEGSIVLAKNVDSEAIGQFSVCWSLVIEDNVRIDCSDDEGFADQMPGWLQSHL